jgi:hypothetical protein
MKKLFAITCTVLSACCFLAADVAKPKIKVAADGFPAGQDTPEGTACDLIRAFIKRDTTLFTNTCIQPFGQGKDRTNYEAFLERKVKSMREEAARNAPSPAGPKSITKVFAARTLTQRGPASFAYAAFDFRALKFVDLRTIRQNGEPAKYRVMVIKKTDEKWYVHPSPELAGPLTAGLNSEPPSTIDFSEAYEIEK